MANKQIDALAALTTPAAGADIIHAKQGATDKKVTIAQLRSEVGSVNNFYTAGGTANAITLTAAGNTVEVTELFHGLEVNFIAAFTNNSGVTVTIGAFGGKSVEIGGSPLATTTIIAGDLIKLVYSTATSKYELISFSGRKVVADASTETISGNKTFTGTNIYNGVAAGDLLDKSAAEVVAGDWSFNNLNSTFGGVTGSDLVDKSDTEAISGTWTFTNALGTFGGIAEANLVDKSASETISGSWNFTGAGNIFNGIAEADLVDKSALEYITGIWRFQGDLIADRTSDVDAGIRFQNSATGASTADGGYIYTEATTKHLKIRNYDGNVVIGNTLGVNYEAYFHTDGGFVVGSPTGASNGIGSINVSTAYYVNNKKVRDSNDEYDYSNTTGILTAGGFVVVDLTHGLGTDDVIVDMVAQISNGTDDWGMFAIDADQYTTTILGRLNSSAPISVTSPITGKVSVVIENTSGSTGTILYRVTIRKRVV